MRMTKINRNYYIEKTRREEGFDLSGVYRPAYDLNQFKFVNMNMRWIKNIFYHKVGLVKKTTNPP